MHFTEFGCGSGKEIGGHKMDQSASELFHSPACTRTALPALTVTDITTTPTALVEAF